jgi:hypothetical protein
MKKSPKSLERIMIQQKWLNLPAQEWDSQEDCEGYQARWLPVQELIDEFVWQL